VGALSAALGGDPGRGDLWGELAMALVAAGRAREGWDAAVRAVQLAPQSAAAHRAIGTVAAALDDPRQAESAYRHALLLDPADFSTQAALSRLSPRAPTGGRRRAPEPDEPATRRRARDSDEPTTGRRGVPDLDEPTTGRRRALEPDEPTTGRRRAPEPDEPTTGRRRAAEPDEPVTGRRRAPELDEPTSGRRRAAEREEPTGGGRRRAPEPASPEFNGVPVPRRHAAPDDTGGTGAVPSWQRPPEPVPTSAVGIPAWLAPTPTPATTTRYGPPAVPVGATRVPTADGWHRGLITVVRIEWLLAVAVYLGLAFDRVAPYAAGAWAGVGVALGAYGRLRWQAARTRRPPQPDRLPTIAAGLAAAAGVVVVPAAMFGALTAARAGAIAAVTCATIAAVLLARIRG
jgi:hypothetical protein